LQDKINGIINCCTGKSVSLAEQVESYIKEHEFKIKLNYGAFPDRPYDSPGVWGDNKKISEVMGVNA
ncbi:MAG: NAD(P)-dependent oxidoreductase, partial [Clostridiales bacterium]|nr:NAD(P)-dependent oxidoreductase [Clostridiales bacterium]